MKADSEHHNWFWKVVPRHDDLEQLDEQRGVVMRGLHSNSKGCGQVGERWWQLSPRTFLGGLVYDIMEDRFGGKLLTDDEVKGSHR